MRHIHLVWAPDSVLVLQLVLYNDVSRRISGDLGKEEHRMGGGGVGWGKRTGLIKQTTDIIHVLLCGYEFSVECLKIE